MRLCPGVGWHFWTEAVAESFTALFVGEERSSYTPSDLVGIITAMRPAFSTAMAVITTAADAGVISTTVAGEIMNSGDGKMLQAFRTLGDAVAPLDTLGHLRDELTVKCGVGPADHPAAAWIDKGASLSDLERAAALNDTYEMQPYINPPFCRVHYRRMPVRRT